MHSTQYRDARGRPLESQMYLHDARIPVLVKVKEDGTIDDYLVQGFMSFNLTPGRNLLTPMSDDEIRDRRKYSREFSTWINFVSGYPNRNLAGLAAEILKRTNPNSRSSSQSQPK